MSDRGGAVAFTRVHLPYGWLGCMSPHPIRHEGAVYRTAEHLFQCWRFVGSSRRWPTEEPHDPTPILRDPSGLARPQPVGECGYSLAVRRVRAQKSPMAAKMAAKALRQYMVVDPRSPVDVAHMRAVLRLKVAQHPLVAELLATGDRPIVEDCTARPTASGLFWGARWDAARQEWVGQDVLGHLWEELRAELAAELRAEVDRRYNAALSETDEARAAADLPWWDP